MTRLVLMLLLSLSALLRSQTMDHHIIQAKEKVEAAVSNWNELEMLQARAVFERLLEQTDEKWLINYYIAYCDWRLSTHALSINEAKKGKAFIIDGIDRLESAIEEKPDFAEGHALLASLYGNRIAITPWAGFWYGPKSGRAMSTALTLDPTNARVQLLNGTSAYHTPPQFGGGMELAKTALEKSVEAFAAESPAAVMPDWGHAEGYGWLGSVHFSSGDSTAARQMWEKGLEIDPENGWIRHQLMPKLRKR